MMDVDMGAMCVTVETNIDALFRHMRKATEVDIYKNKYRTADGLDKDQHA